MELYPGNIAHTLQRASLVSQKWRSTWDTALRNLGDGSAPSFNEFNGRLGYFLI